ncbi:MAG: peptidylprolyl isomerase [Thermodesulfovibrionales bacterium]|jgi:parvulin-like peptidyl-prolyl isomerase
MVKDNSVTEEQMREFYAKSQLQFLRPERVFVKIVHLNNEADAQALLDKIKGKDKFDTLAADLGKSGKASTTDYGWLEPRIFSKPIAFAMETAKLATVQGPFNLRDGSFYLFKVKERQAPQVVPFEEAREQIKEILRNQEREKAAAQLVETLKKTSKITINVPL